MILQGLCCHHLEPVMFDILVAKNLTCKKIVAETEFQYSSKFRIVGFLSMSGVLNFTTTSMVVVVVDGGSILELTFDHLWAINMAMMMSSY